jgi:hypothetical protein
MTAQIGQDGAYSRQALNERAPVIVIQWRGMEKDDRQAGAEVVEGKSCSGG